MWVDISGRIKLDQQEKLLAFPAEPWRKAEEWKPQQM